MLDSQHASMTLSAMGRSFCKDGAYLSADSDPAEALSLMEKLTPILRELLENSSCKTLYYETDCDLQTVRSLMRHANVATTLKCYVDAFDERERVASEKLTDWIDKLVERSPEEGEVEDGQ